MNADPTDCLQSWRAGRVKQALIRSLLTLRRQAPTLFARGDYIPIPVKGEMRNHVIAFARHLEGAALIVTVPRLVHDLMANEDRLSIDPQYLRDSTLSLPSQLVGHRFTALWSRGNLLPAEAEFPLDRALADFPMSVLHAIESA
jgi:(1->4)-alpha-D-glucan 1-alpha-D-glucosylmutase